MRFRLLSLQTTVGINNYTPSNGMWKPCGGIKIAETHEEALNDHGPQAGSWMVLCEDDHTWRIFKVTKRTETDIVPADEDAPAISGALRS